MKRDRLSTWVAIATILGTIIALLALIPPFVEMFREFEDDSTPSPTIHAPQVLVESESDESKEEPASLTLNAKCPSAIQRQTIEEWARVGEITKAEAQTYINSFDQIRSGGEFSSGDSLPTGTAIITDFGNGESDIYLALPVRAIAHYRSWGVFEVTSEYQAIHAGACMTITP